MLILFHGGPRDGQTLQLPGDQLAADAMTFDHAGWRHTYQRDPEGTGPLAPSTRHYRHVPTATAPLPADGTETERPADARERLRRTASEPWPPAGTVGPGDVPGGRMGGG